MQSHNDNGIELRRQLEAESPSRGPTTAPSKPPTTVPPIDPSLAPSLPPTAAPSEVLTTQKDLKQREIETGTNQPRTS